MSNKTQKRDSQRKLKGWVKLTLGVIGIVLIIILFNKIDYLIKSGISLFNDDRTVVVIDIGHGGKDQGTQSSNGKILEKDIVLSIGNKVLKKLEKDKDIKILATRTTDEFISLKDRNKFEVDNNAQLFISIHANAAPKSSNVDGIETFYWDKENEDSYNLAKVVHDKLIQYTNANDRSIKPGNYQVIRDASCPSILIETGFLTNYLESINLSNDKYQDKIANAIVEGIKEYLQLNSSEDKQG
ncbi:N-acetylmuramoyl-L-alanine amidase family protein [Romboutsia sp. 1001713B170207_170306_H8]|uniref:N-acetylmuramoyl-L-alanine amidase family protein n=1 Tax=Romboutsia sp. 1001713B170207_170306_H8 TaxID=2787112 RepID=UPI0008208AE6|nr:N-acetylmuramoyl-L-alanine amidase [Romboutsia sp. 1001713B170207_170306_H8]SCH52182.1 N-acetylmuramoyl-L-alanine amidase LytC precursor [uncultured Clostridium sp.]